MIDDTYEAQATATKAVVRASMAAVVAGGSALGLYLSSQMLTHSLQDSPSNLTFNRGTVRSNQIKDSPAHKNLITTVKNRLRTQSGKLYSQTGSLTFSSPLDLNLSINKASYTLGAEKIGLRWDIYVRYHDTYNFEYQKWSSITNLPANAKTALNNYGALAQSIGAVVPYKVTIYTLDYLN